MTRLRCVPVDARNGAAVADRKRFADAFTQVIEVLYADAFAEGSATVAKAELNTKRSFRDGA